MNKYIIFSVKATNDIELSLQTQPGRHYYIAFNQSFTGSLCIRKTASLTQCLEEYNGKLLHNGAFRDFWVSWFDTLKVGRGRIPGNDVILDFRVYNPLNVSSISIQARDGIGEWNFFGPVNSTGNLPIDFFLFFCFEKRYEKGTYMYINNSISFPIHVVDYQFLFQIP